MTRTLFTADHHFFHAGIINMCGRPWSSFDDMNDGMIANWNAVVRKDDIVWHLGDLSYRCKERARLRAIFDGLNGRKNLIIGNHDDKNTLSLPWASVAHVAGVTVEGQRMWLSHYAHRAWPGQHRGVWQLFGHSHGRLPGSSLSLDVGVDTWGYAPVTVEQIRERLATLPAPEGEGAPEPDGSAPTI